MSDNIIDKGGVTTCNNQIVNINQKIDELITTRVNKEGRVYTRCDKAEPEHEGAECLVPSLRSLFKPTNILMLGTNMMRIMDVSHALQLRHIDLFCKMPIEKGIVDIKLVSSPLAIEYNDKHNTNGDGIYHKTKSLVKINARLLVKSFSNKVSFITCNSAIGILFNAKHPFFSHNSLPRSRGN